MHNDNDEWVLLPDRKQWSRVLYTNPVCFLCSSTSEQSAHGVKNVMVVSWLTATDNSGGLVLSLNRRRHSVAALEARNANDEIAVRFTLSVPTRGMEELVRQVGSVSGRDVDKFPTVSDETSCHQQRQMNESIVSPFPSTQPLLSDSTTGTVDLNDRKMIAPSTSGTPCSDGKKNATESVSKRQMKKRLRTMGAIHGLQAAPVCLYDGDVSLFCIQDTVAHLVCRVVTITPSRSAERKTGESDHDEDAHVLVMAQVEHVSVRSQYWDCQKNLFRPSRNVPPYLTFFGSQTFGYVVTEECVDSWRSA